ncbi:lysostaphin resistance A-like protein [Chloroflexota bacterium]
MPALIFLVVVGFVEELIFRGVLQYAAIDLFGRWGIVYVSLLFAILHMGFLSWIDLIYVFIVALFFGWVVEKTGSLLGVVLAHGITNIMLYLVAPSFF